jgi:hypothetical protein
MTPLEALLELLERVGASRDAAALVSEDELSRWPAEAVRSLQAQKILARASPAVSVICPGCEQECVMPVETPLAETGAATPFVICDKRDDINRVPVPIERLRQWQCSVEAMCGFVAQSVGVRPTSRQRDSAGQWEIGIASGKKRKQMLCVRVAVELELMAGQNAVPLAEFVRHGVGGYSVDSEAVRQLVDAATAGNSRYTPSNIRREARKLETQALHESWQREYRELKKRRPEMSDVWYSQQIAKNVIADGRSAGTIKKNMKP